MKSSADFEDRIVEGSTKSASSKNLVSDFLECS